MLPQLWSLSEGGGRKDSVLVSSVAVCCSTTKMMERGKLQFNVTGWSV